jgi:hypothetical protein
MSLSYIEDTMDGIKTYILANVQTYLTAVINAQGDNVPLPMVETQNITIGYMDLENQKKWPAIFIVPIAENWGQNNRLGVQDVEMILEVSIVIGGYRESWLASMIYRYASALRNMFMSDITIGDNTNAQRLEPEHRVDYFQRTYAKEDLKAAKLTISVTKDVP